MKEGKILAISVSEKKGTKKHNIDSVLLKEGFGIIGDAHAGSQNRQVSLLAVESIEKMRAKGLNVKPGDFAENIATQAIDLLNLGIGTRLRLGDEAIVEITQFGKDCRRRCHIYYQAGDCIMPREGVFAKVLKGGKIKTGDEIVVIEECIK